MSTASTNPPLEGRPTATPLLHATTSQTVGPYLHIGLAPRDCADIPFDGSTGQTDRITIEGTVIDGDGAPLADGMLEIWQAGADGRYAHPHDARSGLDETARGADGFGRVPTMDGGRFRFTTLKPGRVPAPDGSLQAPHLVIAVFARGLLKHLSTRLYFADEVAANAEDFVLRLVPAERRDTLLAAVAGDRSYRWTLTLQAATNAETVFFDY